MTETANGVPGLSEPTPDNVRSVRVLAGQGEKADENPQRVARRQYGPGRGREAQRPERSPGDAWRT
jgi:hypothetical protein